MLISLWTFSITFAVSAVLIFETLKVPALIIDLYNLSTNYSDSEIDNINNEPNLALTKSPSLKERNNKGFEL